jgi:hypothetical protein
LVLSEIEHEDLSANFNHILFLVSRQTLPGENPHYFTLGSKFNQQSRVLGVEPPLNSGHSSLYLHTSPHIPDDSHTANLPPLAHHLDEQRFTFFRGRVIAHMYQYAEEHRGDESPTKYVRPHPACVFDIKVPDGGIMLEK